MKSLNYILLTFFDEDTIRIMSDDILTLYFEFQDGENFCQDGGIVYQSLHPDVSVLEFSSAADVAHHRFLIPDEDVVSVFDRIKNSKDIRSIQLFYQDGSQDMFFLPFSDGDQNSNLYQHCRITDKHTLRLGICPSYAEGIYFPL